MSEVLITKLFTDAILQVIYISAPPLGISVIVGLIISILQAATSIQEQTLTFVPKLFAVFITMIIFASWIINGFVIYTEKLFELMSKVPYGTF